VNEYKINLLAKIQVPVSAVMFPDEKSKYSVVTKPERAAEAFFFI
jgi:hypothetical protein